MRSYFDNPGCSFLVSDTETNSCLYFSYDDFHDEFYYHVKDMHVNNEMQELKDPTNCIKLLTRLGYYHRMEYHNWINCDRNDLNAFQRWKF